MATSKRLQVLIAVDDSPAAKAVIATVLELPWPDATRVRGVVALRDRYFGLQSKERDNALEASLQDAAAAARYALALRWNDVQFAAIDKAPLEAILGEARRARADVVALGWRGHGSFRRLLAGSVSRAVAARAECPVLIARTAPSRVRRFVIGYDGSPNARRAVRLLSRLKPTRSSLAVLVKVIDEPIELPARASRLPAAVRARVEADMAALNAERHEQALASLKSAAAQLTSRGWVTKTEVRTGSPVVGLLSAARAHRADVLVVGARETRGLRRALLGSVAEGTLNNSHKPVLLVR